MSSRWLGAILAAATLLACGTAAAGQVTDLRRLPVITGDAGASVAKAAVCAACHGPEGHSLVS